MENTVLDNQPTSVREEMLNKLNTKKQEKRKSGNFATGKFGKALMLTMSILTLSSGLISLVYAIVKSIFF